MPKKTLLFAWAVPAAGLAGGPDHTWVSTFDCTGHDYKSIDNVKAAGELFWFSWGDFHRKCRAGGDLGKALGDQELAQCLVLANVPSQSQQNACGTIFRYGIDGVCHQLANQVLYATVNGHGKPLIVKKARGYWASSFRYDDYGIPSAAAAFRAKVQACGGRSQRATRDPKMTTVSDEFEAHAQEVLGEKSPKLLAELLDLRTRAMRTTIRSNNPSAATLNAQNQRLFDEAAKLLGPERFYDVFGFHPGEKMELVDPAFMAARPSQQKRGGLAVPVAVSRSASTMPTVTLKHLAAALAESHEMSKRQAEAVLGDFVGNVVKHLKKGERIRIGGLGILQVRKRAARMGRNPATGEQIKIKTSKKVAFRAAKELKESI
jgi:nucleoid DNA-binding protein